VVEARGGTTDKADLATETAADAVVDAVAVATVTEVVSIGGTNGAVVEAAAQDDGSTSAALPVVDSAETTAQSPDSEVAATPVWPLLAGLGLVAMAGVTFVIMRRRGPV
jgi:hypothetical protein